MKKTAAILFSLLTVLLLCACSGPTQELDEMRAAFDESLNNYEREITRLESENSGLASEIETLSDSLKEANSLIEEMEKELEELSVYRGLSEAETIARQEEAELKAETDRIERERILEEERVKREQEEAEAKAAKEAEEKLGYETGITYDQLARTPDDYLAKKVKFYGRVIQVIESATSSEVNLRVATRGNYDDVILVVYEGDIIPSRVLEDDWITLYGVSGGLYSYQSTGSGTITIPLIFVEKIDQ